MKRKTIFLIAAGLVIISDYVLFDFEFSDFLHSRTDVIDLTKKYKIQNDNVFPIYIPEEKMEIKNCKQLSKYKIEKFGVFEKEKITLLKRNCSIMKILTKAKTVKKDFVKNIKLVEFEKFSSNIAFSLIFDQNEMKKIKDINKMKTLKDLMTADIIRIDIINDREIRIKNSFNKEFIKIKEISRSDFVDDNHKEIFAEVAFADEKLEFVREYKMIFLSRKNDNDLIDLVK